MPQALPIIYGISALVAGGSAVYAATRGGPNLDKPEAPPPPPGIALEDTGIDAAALQRKRIGRSSTILTRPSGLSDAPTTKPTLLGQ
jgi:hypothetical protein